MAIRWTKWLWDNRTVKAPERWVLMSLCDRAHERTGIAWPTHADTARRVATEPRAVRYALASLERCGEIVVLRRGGGRARPNLILVRGGRTDEELRPVVESTCKRMGLTVPETWQPTATISNAGNVATQRPKRGNAARKRGNGTSKTWQPAAYEPSGTVNLEPSGTGSPAEPARPNNETPAGADGGEIITRDTGAAAAQSGSSGKVKVPQWARDEWEGLPTSAQAEVRLECERYAAADGGKPGEFLARALMARRKPTAQKIEHDEHTQAFGAALSAARLRGKAREQNDS